MAGERISRFDMYRVRPASGWTKLQVNEAVSATDLARLTAEMRDTLDAAMRDAVFEANRTSRLRSRRGAIYRSIMSGVRTRGSGIPATVSVTFGMEPWVAIHETGGTIRPRTKRYLTLPMPAAMRVDGRLKRRSAAGWKDYNTFVFKAKSGNRFIAYKDKSSGRLVLLYLLVNEVTLNRRLFLREAILRQENMVVAQWSTAVMRIFNNVDFYGLAFEGKMQ